jgi:hypothetical protein
MLAFALLGPTPATGGSAVSLNYAASAFEAVESQHPQQRLGHRL